MPPVLVDPCDGRGAEVEVIREEDQTVPVLQFDFHPTERAARFVLLGTGGTVERDGLVRHDAAAARDRPPVDDRVGRAVLQPRDEVDARRIERRKPPKVDVPPIHHQDGAARVRGLAGDRHLVLLARGDHDGRRQVAVMVQREVEFDRALGPTERRPRKHLRAEVDDRGVDRQQLVLEPEPLRRGDAPAALEQLIEDLLIELPRAMGIRIGQARSGRRRGAQVGQLALATRQAPADFPQGIGAAELTEQHRDELIPTPEALRRPRGACGDHGLLKVGPWKELEQLTKDAAESGQGVALPYDVREP